jgi:SpoVK/Ycf46/Vps4 family AAA+-type ATPase
MNSAATNRFSTKIFIDKPDQKAIKQALNLWLKKHPSAKEFLANESAVKDIARDLVGYGYRDLQNIKDLALEKMMNLKLNAFNTHQDTHQIKLTPELIREALSEYARTSFNNKGAKKTA